MDKLNASYQIRYVFIDPVSYNISNKIDVTTSITVTRKMKIDDLNFMHFHEKPKLIFHSRISDRAAWSNGIIYRMWIDHKFDMHNKKISRTPGLHYLDTQ